MLRIFVYDCRVFKMAQVKHSNRSICSHRCKHITTSTSYRKNVSCHFRQILMNSHLTENKLSSVSKIFCLPLLNAMSYTSLSWAISCVFTCPVTMLTLPITCPVSSPHIVHVVSMLEVPFVNKNYTINFGFQAPIYKMPNNCRYIYLYLVNWGRLHSSRMKWEVRKSLSFYYCSKDTPALFRAHQPSIPWDNHPMWPKDREKSLYYRGST